MPNSLPDLSPAAEVRALLTSVLPDAILSDATVDSGHQPLLLMQTQHSVAAFAFANGRAEESYEVLYNGFKKHYSNQQGRWDALDLAFVFCVQPDFPQIERLCSQVETDVYFCRKFVIPLRHPVNAALARLPFLPLSPLPGQTLRPPSAQTFLHQCGVPAELAEFLVVQQRRGPDGIVEDCISERFGTPQKLARASAKQVADPHRKTGDVRLEAVEIQNFRAYRRPQTFVLGADVTILYGPNGFGKTSFFDAIDFAITGGIGRLESSRQSELTKIARHLDTGSEDSTVSIRIRSSGNVHQITRSVRDCNRAVLDGQRTDRKAILSEVTSGGIAATERVDHLVSLFRASHLFSQEQQELTKNFQDDCQLSAEIVSRMLAFEDYANAVNKAAKVRDVLKRTNDDASEKIKTLTEQIAADNKEIEGLGRTAMAHTNIEALDTEVDALRAKLVMAGIEVTTGKTDTAMVRGWRAALESRHAQSLAASNRLTDLATEVAKLARGRAEIAAVQLQIAQKDTALKAAEEKRIAAEMALQHAEEQLAEMTTKRVQAQTRADLLEWVRNTQPEYLRLVAHQRQLSVESQRIADELTHLQATEDKAPGELRDVEAGAAQVAEQLNVRRAHLTEAQALNQAIPRWEANRTRLTTILQSDQAQLKQMESLRAEERELAPQLAAATAEEQRLVQQIAEADKNQSELRKLLSQLQGHVRTGICPLCGDDHGSREHLLQRIQEHVAMDAASGTRADLSGVRERARRLANQVAANKQKQQAADGQSVALRNERAMLESEMAQFVTAASRLTIAVEASGPAPTEQVQALAARLQQEVAELEKQSQKVGAAVESARAAVADAKNAVTVKKAEADEKKALLAGAQQETNRLRTDPRLTEVSLDIKPEKLAELEQINLKDIEGFNREAAKAEAEANQKKPEIDVFSHEVTTLKAHVASLRTQLGNLQKAITQISAMLEESKLPADSSEESVFALIAEQSRLQTQLLALRDTASSLEMAMDAATTAAALASLRQTVRKWENLVAEAKAKRDGHRPWLKYFDQVAGLLSSQQNEAIASFIREYGPRTSIIQRRLRSVYGFDDIEMKSRESSIAVRVMRNGQELRPVDYFSQSQLQTLLLGLFLTACTSQTWSAFSPVFLDDPVTHFDDLNTYAFLDLIVGLLESTVEKRQFLISTCDEKFLQLARQKFRHLNERARFYVFTGIGADGPTVEGPS